jgi:hypothetical protein
MANGFLHSYPSSDNISLPALIDTLFEQQLATWPQLQSGYEGLRAVRSRELRISGNSILVQWNSRRMVSTGARVDPKSISERKCFLCGANLSSEQKGVDYRSEFQILCNPFPIVDRHLTIPKLTHTPQTLSGSIPVLLDLARTIGSAFTTFYNGPQAGASAPDHMHFQACPRGLVPVELAADNFDINGGKVLRGVSVSPMAFAGQKAIILKGAVQEELAQTLEFLLEHAKSVMKFPGEPLLNLFCSFREGTWRLTLFLRRKHRPDIYFKEGDEKLIISPAALDVGGVIVTPLEKDFNRMDAAMVQSIFAEVMALDSQVEQIFASL